MWAQNLPSRSWHSIQFSSNLQWGKHSLEGKNLSSHSTEEKVHFKECHIVGSMWCYWGLKGPAQISQGQASVGLPCNDRKGRLSWCGEFSGRLPISDSLHQYPLVTSFSLSSCPPSAPMSFCYHSCLLTGVAAPAAPKPCLPLSVLHTAATVVLLKCMAELALLCSNTLLVSCSLRNEPKSLQRPSRP